MHSLNGSYEDGIFFRALTFVLQAPLPVSLDLHLAQVLDALVLQQSSFSLQLTERGLHLLPAAHLREREQCELCSHQVR